MASCSANPFRPTLPFQLSQCIEAAPSVTSLWHILAPFGTAVTAAALQQDLHGADPMPHGLMVVQAHGVLDCCSASMQSGARPVSDS